MSLNDRIRELISKLGISNRAFATSINVSQGTLHNIVGARNSTPRAELVAAITKTYPQVSSDWLISGKGEMLDVVRLKHSTHAGSGTEKWTSDQVAAFELSQGDRDNEDAIPFVPIAAEGSYLQGFADEEYIEHMPKFYLPFLGLGSGVYAFQVRGDSMSDRFNNGDVVFGQKVEKNDALRWGEVYVLLCNDGLVVKELRKGPDELHFTLRSYNEHFDPYDILKTEVRQLFRYQASISFNSSNPNRGGVVNFMRVLSEQMGQVQNSLSNLPQAK